MNRDERFRLVVAGVTFWSGLFSTLVTTAILHQSVVPAFLALPAGVMLFIQNRYVSRLWEEK